MGGSIPKIIAFWLIVSVILVSTGAVEVTPAIMSRYVTLEENGSEQWLDFNQQYVENVSGINQNISGSTITTGTDIGFIQILNYVWTAVQSVGYFLAAPVIYMRVLGLPWELQLMLGLVMIVFLVWAIASFIRGSEA